MTKKTNLLTTAKGLFTRDISSHASSRILLWGREKSEAYNPHHNLAELARRVEELPSPHEVEFETDIAKSKSLFNECYNLEKALINTIISIDANRRKRGFIYKLYTSMFYSLKSVVRIKYNNFEQPFFLDKDMKREFFIQKISADIKEAFEVACKPEDRHALINEILIASGLPEYVQTPQTFKPEKVGKEIVAAPVKWEDRAKGSRISPAEFLLTTYQPWIGRGITRGDIKRLDLKLYNALTQWLIRHPADPLAQRIETSFPSGASSANAKLKALGISN